jgi:hypothetical protein
MRTWRAVGASMALALVAAGGARAAVALPHDNDAYSRLVARAEAGDTTVDFHALRFAWLDSAARRRGGDTLRLTQDMNAAVSAQDAARVRADAEQILWIDYTDMLAHKDLRQACQVQADAACAAHEHFLEFGLLNSIVNGRHGRSQADAWEVAQVKEEYFVLAMAGLRVTRQSLVNGDGRMFDRMETVDEHGLAATYFFDVTVMLPKEM